MRELEIKEIAAILHLAPYKIERWVRQGKIPLNHKGEGSYAFDEKKLTGWAENLNISIDFNYKKNSTLKKDKEALDLILAMKKGGFYYDVKGKDIKSILQNVLQHTTIFSPKLKEKILKKILKREEISSTSTPKGIALPHPKDVIEELEEDIVITAFLKDRPILYNKHKPIFALFILLGASDTAYFFLLSKISFCLRSDTLIEMLKKPENPEKIIEVIESIKDRTL